MKKHIILIGMGIGSLYVNAYKYIGYSYYNPAPITHLTAGKKFRDNNVQYASRFEVTTTFVESYDAEQIASYLNPFDTKELRVKESVAANTNPFIDNGAQDILSYNFNLVTQNGTFESLLSFSPVKKVFTLGLNVYKECDFGWIQVTLPFRHMETDMKLQERILNDGGGAAHDLGNFNIGGNFQVGSMKEAFASKNMKYGRINGKRKKYGFSDCLVKIGCEYKNNERVYVRPFVGTILPFSNKAQAEYMFEPILGNGKHFGIVCGSEYGREFIHDSTRNVTFSGIAQVSYLFANHQIRSFDPAGKPWGRYMAMFANQQDFVAQKYSFGINECTKRARVEGGFQFVLNGALSTVRNGNRIKIAYQNVIRTANRTETPSDWSTPAIASLFTNESATNPARGINNLLDGFKNNAYYGIQDNEVSTATASHRTYLAHQLMLSGTKIWERENGDKYYIEGCIGGVLGRTNAVPHEWQIQLSAGGCL